ncbi:MAG: radical SAM protein [Acidobacteria bacterium]|nr:radical SAM protein [Acidobacteriota bacterium]
MGLLSPLFRNRLGLLASYLRRRIRVPGGPLSLAIESTAKCNLFCPMCPRETMYFPPKDMELSLFRKILDDGKDCLEFAVPYGVGEPLLNPEIYDMLAYCRQVGIPSGISTNATILTAEASRKLIEAGLDYIIFAFDGATRETFEKYRKGADFEKVRRNILTFLEVKRKLKSGIFCIVQLVRLKDNSREIPDLIRMWRVEGIDEIRIKKDEVHNEGSAIPGENGARPPLRHPCYLLWRGPMYVHYDGTVFPCCYIYPEESLGNLSRSSLREIWNSEKMVAMRAAHVKGDLSAYKTCRNCPAARPRLPVTLGSFLVNTHTVRRAIPFFERLAQLRNISVFETLK